MLKVGIWLIYALHVVGILPELQMLDQIQFHAGKSKSAGTEYLQRCGIAVAVTVLLALWIGREAERRLIQSEVMEK